MRSQNRRSRGGSVRAAFGVAATAAMMAVLPGPAQAQFWGDWGGQRQQQQRYQQQQQYNPFGDWFRNAPSRPQARPQREREAPADNSRAPSTRKADMKDESKVTNKIVVMGDGMADWLAYGLEDAFSEQPDIGIVRKHRASSGLIHYDGRKDVDWAHMAREIIAAEKPNFIVMMVGVNDRQSIHEQAPAPATHAAGKKGGATQPEPAPAAEKLDPEALARQSAEEQNAAIEAKAEEVAAAKEEREREKERAAHPSGTFEFHSEQWEAAYVKRIDATIAAMKSAGVPVLWVGLPSQRNSKVSSDTGYLNDLYRQRAEKAGVVYVDIWDGFVDEGGRYSTQGPDYEGQTRRLRSGDGVYFTKAGARKLAHYVEREIQRNLTNRAVPVALPVEPALPTPGGRGSPASRPMAGPVVPLTVSTGGGNELLGGGRATRQPASDPVATRVLIKGEPIAAPAGRADDFAWPRGSNATPLAEPASAAVPDSTPARAAPPKPTRSSKQTATSANKSAAAEEPEAEPAPPPVRKRPRRSSQSAPRPPLAINPSTWFR